MKTLRTLLLVTCSLFASITSANQCISVTTSGHGKPVILLPGFLSDARVWEILTQDLSSQYQVHTVSIAGMASSEACDGAESIIDNAKKELLDYIDAQRLDKPVLVGHSMGGLIAFDLAIKNQAKFAAIVSVDGLPFIGPVFTRSNATQVKDLQGQAQAIKSMYENASKQQLEQMTSQGLFLQTALADKQKVIVEMAMESDPKTAGSAIYTVMTTDLRMQLTSLNTPTLLIGASGAFANDAQKQSAQTLYQEQLNAAPNARLIMNTNSRHFVMWDQPQWLANTVASFMEEQL